MLSDQHKLVSNICNNAKAVRTNRITAESSDNLATKIEQQNLVK